MSGRLSAFQLPAQAEEVGARLAGELRRNKAIMGVFDEGCMGMYNAIIPDELLHPTGVFKERLSQSALYAEMRQVSDAESAAQCGRWLDAKGMTFVTGPNPETDLTDAQILEQCRMYVAALRIADDFGCDTIGIQYQQGLKDLAPASDLAEGLLNNVDRPPVTARGNGRVLYEGKALPHFNEVDECAGLDALVTNRIWTALGYAPETTLHDVRYGEPYRVERARGIRLGLRDFRRGAARPFHRRVRGLGQRTAAGDVLPARRRQPERREQARRDRLEPDLRGWRKAEGGHRPGEGGRTAAGGDGAALADHDAAVADYARRAVWSDAAIN